MRKRSDKELNFEINILPILDILSVLICFLLLTAVWVQLGTLDIKQAVGDNTIASNQKNPPSLFATFSDKSIQLSIRDSNTQVGNEFTINNTSEGISWSDLTEKIQALKLQIPDLKTGVIMPVAKTNYGDVIQLIDKLKKNNITDIGISPLN